MPRRQRFTIPGIPQHVIQRGNNREPCFFADKDYHYYLDTLKRKLGSDPGFLVESDLVIV